VDFDVLYICAESNGNYKKYRSYVKDHCIQPETKFILDVMGDYYKTYSVDKVDWEALDSFIFSKHSARIGKTVTVVKSILERAKKYEPSIAYDEVIKSFIEKDYVAQVMEECSQVLSGSSDLEHVHELSTKGLKDLGRFIDVESMFVTPDVEAVCERISTTGYEWRMMFFNESLGPLRDGDFVLLAARVECGKTTLLASEISYILPQMPKDRPIIWVNNEERSEQVFFRVVQSALNFTTEEVMADSKNAMKLYDDHRNERKLLITDGKVNHVKNLTSLFQDVNPGMIVFDQLDKVSGFHNDEGEHIRLGKLYKWARDLAKEYGPVIAVSQLSADVDKMEWPMFIGLDSLRGSKVDKPGEVDAIVTVGKAMEPKAGEMFQRSINIPKNKLAGRGPYHREDMRHGQAIVTIDPLRGRYNG
jgi:replicative DNA helicase